MTYARRREILDADSHVMELPGFLDDFLEPAYRGRLRDLEVEALKPALRAALARADARRTDSATAASADRQLMEDKGWMAVGAFEPDGRSHALDLLGFERQLVFATFASVMYMGRDLDLVYAGSRAQNRAMADFCSADERLVAVGYVPLSDPTRAVELAVEAIGLGCGAIMVPSTAAGGRSPTHPELNWFWDTLSEANVPFVLHVGGGGRLLDPAFHNNGMPVTDHLGGGENVRSKDYLAIHHSPEVFLGTLIYDGLFDRFPTLRGGCIEQGAGWVVSWLRALDHGQRSFRRTEEPLRKLEHEPSAYVHRHLKFTPYPGEPVGWMIEQAGGELFMFSTDYPHPEGSRDPLAKFEDALVGTGADDEARFYSGNMAELLDGPQASGARSRYSSVAGSGSPPK